MKFENLRKGSSNSSVKLARATPTHLVNKGNWLLELED